ncbi:hypothetical protein L1987_48462 [Smallanthus sonchifolius]|uniref:Uncharacterized protein n=1 Tax=Smallanthus sonchifolius TaxID=185202 RepID=A0ACB9FSN4_9ASTR|nr:hypothetical protein L1987_48462 [Smallanthus sonchifolius]
MISPKYVHLGYSWQKGFMHSTSETGRREAGRRRERLPTPETVQVTAEEAEEDALTHKAEPLKYTHCDIDISFVLRLSCGTIPFANHDHAKRVLFHAQIHSQQAIGYSTTNPRLRVDILTHDLFDTQKPPFKIVHSDCLETPKYKNGLRFQLGDEYYKDQCAIIVVTDPWYVSIRTH